ncbi:unnamed protein product, partial [Caretta caretta]
MPEQVVGCCGHLATLVPRSGELGPILARFYLSTDYFWNRK